MSIRFAELASSSTPLGVLSLRRRLEPSRLVDVYEVKLGDEFLMSSLFTVAEVELARLALAHLDGGTLDVVVGGLGLGYTARAVLDDDRVGSMIVVEAFADVIDWHVRRLLPDAGGLVDDPRCRLVHADFFAMARGESGFDPLVARRRVDAVLVDIDHTPGHRLDASHADFYAPAGLARTARFLSDDGVLGVWSDDPPDEGFLATLGEVFDDVRAEVVTFPNFYTGGESSNTVYIARSAWLRGCS